MTQSPSASELIIEEATSWPGVTAAPGDRHGDRAAHFGFPKPVWAELYEQGRIVHHPVFPDQPGFGARRIDDDADIRDVIALLRINYDRVIARYGVPVAH
jgi:hypothetical protein